MPQLFTVRWPLFARLEAFLFFPIAVLLASEIEQVQMFVDRGLSPTLSPIGAQMGMPNYAAIWVELTLAVLLPYVVLLIVVDRFLTIRKGFAVLSVIVIAVWTLIAQNYSDQLAGFVPARFTVGWLTLGQQAALSVGGVALLLHIWPLLVGLRDRGDVAMRLVAAHEERNYRPGEMTKERRAQDIYYRQTADFRGWRPQEQLEGMGGGGPRENGAVKVLSVITWIAVIAGAAAAWHNWNDYNAVSRQASSAAGAPEVNTGQLASHHTATAGAALPMGPLNQGAGPLPQVAVPHSSVTAFLPSVQHPNEISANGRSSSISVGFNEAVAERGTDGSFAFDAVVNGGHARMLFDTGASVVTLRAEDAARLGINMSRLIYSTKIKTANGTAEVAPVIIDTLMIGNITQRNVVGCVAKEGTLHENLLGQAFLARLSGFNVEKNLLVLRGR